MEEKKSIWPFAMTYGAAIGLVSVIVSILFYFISPPDLSSGSPKGGWIQSLISIAIMGLIIVWAIRKFRDEELEGNISYGRSLKITLAMSIPVMVITSIYTYTFFAFIEPDMISKITELQIEKMAEKGMSEEKIQESMGYMNKFNSPISYALFSLGGAFIQMLLIGLITSIFTRKEPVIAE